MVQAVLWVLRELVCSLSEELRSKTVIVEVFFLLLFLLSWRVELWITFCIFLPGISAAWPCGRIEQEAEAFCDQGDVEARRRDFPCLLFTWSTVKTEHYPGHYSESCKHGQVATKPYERRIA